jgi:hypothetical protein
VSTNKFRGALAGAPEESVAGMRYLEKIVQLPFFLPEVGFPALRTMLAPSVGDLARREPFWEILRIGLGTNPRRAKRFVNVLNLAMAHQPADADAQAWVLQLAILLIIRSEHREFFHQLTHDPDLWQEPERWPLDDQRAGLRKLLDLRYPTAPSGEEVTAMLSIVEHTQIAALPAPLRPAR